MLCLMWVACITVKRTKIKFCETFKLKIDPFPLVHGTFLVSNGKKEKLDLLGFEAGLGFSISEAL